LTRVLLLVFLLPLALRGQDTTQAYPWRLSYFPYVTASPNDGVMAMGRAVLFQQSRWDARTSIDKQVAVEGGYSTKDAWLARLRADMPKLAPGWRLQAIAQAERDANYFTDDQINAHAQRQFVSVEVTRRIVGELSVAIRGEVNHLDLSYTNTQLNGTIEAQQTDFRGRVALVLDQRDREYDTRKGTLVQAGVFVGSDNSYVPKNYSGWFGLGSAWLPLGEKTRVTARAGFRLNSTLPTDAARIIPAWEDQILVVGGPESNRGLPIGAGTSDGIGLAGAEIRHDLKVFPAGAIAILIFVDASEAFNSEDDAVAASLNLSAAAPLPVPHRWIVSPGAGVSLRLLRNAILTATVARALGATRVYVSSGWAW
jgi:outer membrane protein assembly factor BamA